MTNPPRPPGPPPARPPAPRPPAAPSAAPGDEAETPKKPFLSPAMIGYLVSGGIVLLVVLVLFGRWALQRFGGDHIAYPTKATTATGRLDAIGLRLEIAKITKPAPAGPGDALKVYQSLIADAKAAAPRGDIKLFYGVAKDERNPAKNPKLKVMIDKICQAADTGYDEAYDLVFDDLPINAKTSWLCSSTIRAFGLVMMYASMDAQADKRLDEAEKYNRAVLIFGDRLWRRGTYVANRSAGLALISDGLLRFQRLYSKDGRDDTARMDATVQAYKIDLMETARRWKNKEGEIFRTVNHFAGDLWNLAEKDKDRSWRIEGVMWLGLAKYLPGEPGNSNNAAAIDRYLEKRAGDPDRIIAEKAKEARAFVDGDQNQIEEDPMAAQ